ncbi:MULTISPECIES: NUDIX domain-containing protein [unclassified Knoellia]|uniref:NUDIX domain-containing protein n=1 Tax=Knoellia altitudinis TaxID=3404795 RepID=UPI003607B4F1
MTDHLSRWVAAIGAVLAGLLPWLMGDLEVVSRIAVTLGVLMIALVVVVALLLLDRTSANSGLHTEPFSSALEKSGGSSAIRASPRLATELTQGDELLDVADRATFVGMTFRSLSAALSGHATSPVNLKEVTLNVFALPVLQLLHPTLRGRPQLLEEWRANVHSTIVGILAASPNLQRLHVHLLDADPTFTMSKLRVPQNDDAAPLWCLRWTPVVEGIAPNRMPTLHLESKDTDTNASDPMFVAFDDLASELVERRAIRHFPILRRDVNYLRADIAGFVDSLLEVSTHPLVRKRDIPFSVTLQAPIGIVPDLHSIQPWELGAIYQRFVARDGVTSFDVNLDVANRRATVLVDDGLNTPRFEGNVQGDHYVGAFALLVLGPLGGREVLMVDKPKPGWELDVPGGKIAEGDTDWSSAVHRELLEELSFHVSREVTFAPSAWVYDAKSRKEGKPVIAGYAVHYLDQKDADYARAFLVGGAEASGAKISKVKVDRILERKREAYGSGLSEEVVCHAPLSAMERI